jgi:hypothetical protein
MYESRLCSEYKMTGSQQGPDTVSPQIKSGVRRPQFVTDKVANVKNVYKCQCKNPVHGKSPSEPQLDGCSITFDEPLYDFENGYLCLWCDKGCKNRGVSK